MGYLGKFGVAHPIYNCRFNICRIATTTISSITTNVITAVSVNGVPGDLDGFFGPEGMSKQKHGKVNKVILGPSTHASYTGRTETHDVLSVASSTQITIENTPSYSYSSSDPITMIGSGMPDGWVSGAEGYLNQKFAGGSIIDSNSYHDPYVFAVTGLTAAADDLNYAAINIGRLIPSTYYRFTMYYKTSANFVPSSSPSISKAYIVEEGLANSSSILTITQQSSFTELTATFFSTATQTEDAHVVLYMENATGDGLYVEGFSLTHVMYDESGYTSGITSIEEYPDLGSVRVRHNQFQGRTLQNIDKVAYKTASVLSNHLPVTKYQITYHISHMSGSNHGYLESLLDWQQRGSLLNHFPDLIGLPYCLTGRITKLSERADMGDLTERNVYLTFEEA